MTYITGSLVGVGDSITIGVGAGIDWGTQVTTDLSLAPYHFEAHSGIGLDHDIFGSIGGNSLINLAASEVDGFLTTNPQPFLGVFAGTNDLLYGYTGAQTLTAFQTYIQARLTAGWSPRHIIAITALSRSDISDSQRLIYNAGIVSSAGTYGYLVARTDANPFIGSTGASTNTTYFGDGVHPTTAGQLIITSIVEAVSPGVAGIATRLHS